MLLLSKSYWFIFFINKKCTLISVFIALLTFHMKQCEKTCFKKQIVPQKYTVKNMKGLWRLLTFVYINYGEKSHMINMVAILIITHSVFLFIEVIIFCLRECLLILLHLWPWTLQRMTFVVLKLLSLEAFVSLSVWYWFCLFVMMCILLSVNFVIWQFPLHVPCMWIITPTPHLTPLFLHSFVLRVAVLLVVRSICFLCVGGLLDNESQCGYKMCENLEFFFKIYVQNFQDKILENN